MPLKDDTTRKFKLVNAATDVFLSAIQRAERFVYGYVRDFLDTLPRESGRLVSGPVNLAQLNRLESPLLNFLAGRDGIGSALPDYLQNFDEVERLNRAIYSGYLPAEDALRISRMAFTPERTFLVDSVTQGVTERAALRINLVNPIRKVLYAGITFRQPIKTVQANLRDELVTQAGSSSRLLRYTRQITQDAISQFDGAINDRIRDDLELDGMYYVGSLIKTSRDNCEELVRGSGRFADLAIKPGLFRVKDIPKIVDRAKGRSGWNEACTAETFAQFRGGYGCRHETYYVRLDDEVGTEKLIKATD
ncbi:hypothetical protein LEM8419_03556 [Neolewinella maritima]|uniref:Uncharacterized protein n=1 Tax=Neolewinella maritima TaxID=1383882 RepID=A0ABN8FE21_9BACT|nr:hypothetical protein [Neolewinella maritima]CAH1002684.1 hypothetical protein LEM8419_03556 [Neolewinella maritima]